MSLDKSPRPPEQEAVRTTIVGGRPPGCGKGIGPVPRGLEVLVKKASVDPHFKTTLLAKRAAAADEIGLTLSLAEAQMLRIAPAAQLDAIIANAQVREEHRPAFLGKVAAVMLAALGMFQTGCEDRDASAPSAPEAQAPPEATATNNPTTTEPKIEIVAGDRVEVPVREPNVTILGIVADRPPTTQPGRIEPAGEPRVVVFGFIADRPPTTRPEDTRIRGIRPIPPTTQPENTVIRGIRPIPREPGVAQYGVRPDRPQMQDERPFPPAIAGTMPRIPPKAPTTKPTTQPAPTPPEDKNEDR